MLFAALDDDYDVEKDDVDDAKKIQINISNSEQMTQKIFRKQM